MDLMTREVGPYFGLNFPLECPGVPAPVLDTKSTWSHPQDYDQQARALIHRFEQNFKQFVGDVFAQIVAVGPTTR